MTDIDTEALDRVDKVSDLIKKLVENPNDNDSIYKEVDKMLANSTDTLKEFNRTYINKSGDTNGNYTKDAFIEEMERDANERAKRKAQSKAKADIVKSKANDYYKANDFEKAITFYTKAMNECKDYDILYTNRAQAYLKIDKIQEALNDCDMALNISPKNHKAMLHKGRSLVRLNRFDEAIDNYNKVLEIAPNLSNYMKEFFDEANKLKQNLEIKKKSAVAFEEKNQKKNEFIDEIIEKLLSKSEQSVEYYIGGMELLLQILAENNEKLESLQLDMKNQNRIFENKSGLQNKLKTIWTKKHQKLSDVDWNLLSLWMEFLKQITRNDESIIISLFHDSSIIASIDFCCKSTQKMPFSLLSPTVFLLYQISTTDTGLQQMIDKFTIKSIISITLEAINQDQKKYLINIGMQLFQNLVQSNRFKIALGKDEELVISVIDCLHAIFLANITGDTHELSSVISIIELLADNSSIRSRLIKHNKFLDDCMNTIEARLPLQDDEKHSAVLLQLFSMIHNLLIRTKNSLMGDKVKSVCNKIVISSSYLLSNHTSSEMRSVLIQVLSQMLVTLTDDKLKSWCEDRTTSLSEDGDNISMCRSLSRQSSLTDVGYLDKVCKPLKLCITILDARSHPLLSYAIKILTLASKVNEAVRFLCCDVRERVLKLQSLLYADKTELDEVLSGNICLLFINCVSETPLAEHLSNTTIIKDLLRICADANKTDCKRNAAIFASNLAQSNHVHRSELSKLNGFNIISKFNNWS